MRSCRSQSSASVHPPESQLKADLPRAGGSPWSCCWSTSLNWRLGPRSLRALTPESEWGSVLVFTVLEMWTDLCVCSSHPLVILPYTSSELGAAQTDTLQVDSESVSRLVLSNSV